MVAEVLIIVIAVVVAFEVFEHVIVPLIGARAGRRGKPLTGPEGMVGKVVEVRRWVGREGVVSVGGEIWQAVSRTPLADGDMAIIVSVTGLTLRLEPLEGPVAPAGSPGPLPPP